MSADLFAAFGPPSTADEPRSSVDVPKESQASSASELGQDAWGDFQTPSSEWKESFSDIKNDEPNPWEDSGSLEHGFQDVPRPSLTTTSSFDMLGGSTISNFEPVVGQKARETVLSDSPVQLSHSETLADPNVEVLFDAADADDGDNDDDFGDFETVPAQSFSPKSKPRSLNLVEDAHLPKMQEAVINLLGDSSPPKPEKSEIDLLGESSSPKMNTTTVDLLSAAPLPSPYPEALKSPSFRQRNPFADLSVATNPQPSWPGAAERKGSMTPTTAWPSFTSAKLAPYQDSPVPGGKEEEDWDDFLDVPASQGPGTTQPPSKSITTSSSALEGKVSVPKSTSMPLRTPPSRPTHRSRLSQSSTPGPSEPAPAPPKPASPEPPPRPTNIPPPSILLPLFPPIFAPPIPTAPASLRTYLSAATTAARIISGRKQRWKRDTLLAQSTKISSLGGGTTGMKLAGVDRAESAREEREVAEVVRAWRAQLGRLRGIVAAANNEAESGSPVGKIPELGSGSAVRAAGPAEGAITAGYACAMCGLRREERVAGVDDGAGAVQDSFSEWWAEHWGHVACRSFWEGHEAELRSR